MSGVRGTKWGRRGGGASFKRTGKEVGVRSWWTLNAVLKNLEWILRGLETRVRPSAVEGYE